MKTQISCRPQFFVDTWIYIHVISQWDWGGVRGSVRLCSVIFYTSPLACSCLGHVHAGSVFILQAACQTSDILFRSVNLKQLHASDNVPIATIQIQINNILSRHCHVATPSDHQQQWVFQTHEIIKKLYLYLSFYQDRKRTYNGAWGRILLTIDVIQNE